MNDALFFFDPEDEYGWLANYSPNSFFLDGKEWPSVEHYFQAGKFEDEARAERIRRCRSASEAKAVAKIMDAHKRDNWSEIRVEIMRRGIEGKFRQNPELATQLLDIYGQELVEAAPDDNFWGVGNDGTGANMMGKLLMELRGRLRRERRSQR